MPGPVDGAMSPQLHRCEPRATTGRSPQPGCSSELLDDGGKQLERRRSHRMRDERAAAVGLIVQALRVHLGHCADFSFGGAYIRTRVALKPGACLSLDFHPRALPPFRVEARVVRVGSDGFACAFEHPRNEALARLALWLAACDPRQPRSGTLDSLD